MCLRRAVHEGGLRQQGIENGVGSFDVFAGHGRSLLDESSPVCRASG
jgi:hypothetical protein